MTSRKRSITRKKLRCKNKIAIPGIEQNIHNEAPPSKTDDGMDVDEQQPGKDDVENGSYTKFNSH